MASITLIYASTSGHTEFVVDTAIAHWKQATVSKRRAEKATEEDFRKDDLLILASGTWNTGGIEGQLNPHMHKLLRETVKDIDLNGKKVGIIALGDERYYFTAAAKHHLEEFITSHGGVIAEPVLRIINEPYGQEATIEKWAESFAKDYDLTPNT